VCHGHRRHDCLPVRDQTLRRRIAGLVRRLAKLGDPADIPIGIERPNGRLVDLLLEAGHPVAPVKPNAIKTWREGEVLSGAKSDAGDAAVIAEYPRPRQHRLRVATPYSDQTKAPRTLVGTRDDLVEMRVAATNQLSALLEAYWPGTKAVFAGRRVGDQLGVLDPLPNPGRRRTARREARASILGRARLLRPAPGR
jgi:transposase